MVIEPLGEEADAKLEFLLYCHRLLVVPEQQVVGAAQDQHLEA